MAFSLAETSGGCHKNLRRIGPLETVRVLLAGVSRSKLEITATRGRMRFPMTAAERMLRPLAQADPEVFSLTQQEAERQDGQLELIASENFTSEAVLEATGSVFT